MATQLTDVLTRVFGLVNQAKVELSLNNPIGAFEALNRISEYLVSVDISEDPHSQQKDEDAQDDWRFNPDKFA